MDPPVTEEDAPPVELADTVFAKWCGLEKVSELSQRNLVKEQLQDPTLGLLRETAASERESLEMAEGFFVQGDVLMRKWWLPDRPATEEWSVCEQIVLPRCYQGKVLRMAHESPLAGHVGVRKTLARIRQYFYWPQLRKDAVNFCRSCHECQVVGKPNQNVPKAPLNPIPVMEEPFAKVIIDCVGPLPKTRKGQEFCLPSWIVALSLQRLFP